MLLPHPPGTAPDLSDAAAGSAGDPPGKLSDLTDRLDRLQAALGAEEKRSVLIVLQGRDACGKDGTVRRVFGNLNPAYCVVTSFKRPTPLELRHDYLWRAHQAVPPRGTIGIFNRSHYEDVLAVRIHNLQPEAVWRQRYQHINQFEQMLTDEGVIIRKFFLHISREEQRRRLEDRLADPAKNWKFQPGDLAERALWDDFTAAYQEVLQRCSTAHAPWFIVPADRNKSRDHAVAEQVVQTLEAMNPQYPAADPAVLAFRGKIL